MKIAKILIIVLGVIIVILVCVLIFYNPTKAPSSAPQTQNEPATTTTQY